MSSGIQILKQGNLHFLSLLVLLFCASSSFAQNSNPFEIKSRLKAPVEAENDKADQSPDNSNPFEIKRGQNTGAAAPAIIKKSKKNKRKNRAADKKARQSFLFTVLIGLVIFIAILFTMLREYFWKVYDAFRNDNLLNQLQREQGFLPNTPYLFWYSLFFLTSGIFVFLLLDYSNSLPFDGYWLNLYACIGSVLAFFLFKHFLLSIIKWLFPIKKEISIYNFSIVIFNIIIGLILVPFVVFIGYGPSDLIKISFYISMGLVFITFVFRQLRGLFISGKYLILNKFHFLLYLCTVEIAPVIVLIKLILLYQEA